MVPSIPESRVRQLNDAPPNPRGAFVLYWMTAARRARYNVALERALAWARELNRPLLVFEPLRCDYPYASERLHRFIIEGMHDNAAAFARAGVTYYPYLEPSRGAGRGLLAALAAQAALVVTDDFPTFFVPRMIAAAGARLPVRAEAIDANGLAPMRAAGRTFVSAYLFRRFLQTTLRPHLIAFPRENPLVRHGLPPARLPRAVTARWRPTPTAALARPETLLADLPIDHRLGPGFASGGARAARRRLAAFVTDRLADYDEARNHPDADATTGLSPYLHFGHLASHEVFTAVAEHEGWTPERVAPVADGARTGFWGLSRSAEAFVDQLVTWRELGFNFCAFTPEHATYESLPPWARRTLAEHADDPRPALYSLEQLTRAETHDPLWNAAQRQLVGEGRIHNALRMLWGKKILEWSASPRAAWAALLELNDRYALDGRDPNSITGLGWCLGRFDRAWGPVRPVFGTVRYMSSESSRRKWRLRDYLARYGQDRPR